MKVDLHLSSQPQLLPGPKLLSSSERGCYDRSGRLLHPRISPFTDGALHLMGPGRRVRHKSNDSSPLAICCNNFLTHVEPRCWVGNTEYVQSWNPPRISPAIEAEHEKERDFLLAPQRPVPNQPRAASFFQCDLANYQSKANS